MATASFGGLSATGKIGGYAANGKLSNLTASGKQNSQAATGAINNLTAMGKQAALAADGNLSCFNGTGSMGGNVAAANELKRSYSYKTGTLTFPATPQAYGMEYEDANGVFWQCFAGDTVWYIVNHLAPGV